MLLFLILFYVKSILIFFVKAPIRHKPHHPVRFAVILSIAIVILRCTQDDDGYAQDNSKLYWQPNIHTNYELRVDIIAYPPSFSKLNSTSSTILPSESSLTNSV